MVYISLKYIFRRDCIATSACSLILCLWCNSPFTKINRIRQIFYKSYYPFFNVLRYKYFSILARSGLIASIKSFISLSVVFFQQLCIINVTIKFVSTISIVSILLIIIFNSFRTIRSSSLVRGLGIYGINDIRLGVYHSVDVSIHYSVDTIRRM